MAKTLQSLLGEITALLSSSLAGEARAAARALACDHFRVSFTGLVLRSSEPVSPADEAALIGMARRMAAGEPLQYVTGRAQFFGLDLQVGPGVLIPRPETEELVSLVINWAGGRQGLRVLDIGTGSGCIALSLGRGLSHPTVHAVDASDEALAIASQNANSLGLDVDFRKLDILSPQADVWASSAQYDAVVSNPPYVMLSERESMSVNVLCHEPAMALFVPDDDPLLFYRRIATLCVSGLLAASGCLFFEINEALGNETSEELRRVGFANVSVIKDFTGRDRFVTATLP